MTEDVAERIAELVAAAPPITNDQRDRIAGLLRAAVEVWA
jgi:hypothetical protein